jgi:hypothetical protein
VATIKKRTINVATDDVAEKRETRN